MAKIKLTIDDFEKGRPLDAGIYLGELLDINEEPNKKMDGINWVCRFKVTDKRGNTREMRHWFSSKFATPMIPFIELATGDKFDFEEVRRTGEVEIELDDLKRAVGMEMALEISYDPTKEYKNRIISFLPPEAVTNSAWPFDAPSN